MTVLKAHFNGTYIVLDEPVPPELKPDTQVSVVLSNGEGRTVLAEIANLARQGGLPADFSQQHEHYIKGASRR
jgi:hypothetical protein